MKLRSFRVEKDPYILQRAAFARSILHVGCTRSPETQEKWPQGLIIHKAICDQARRLRQSVVGIDIDQNALEWLSARMPGERLLYGDAQRLEDCLRGERFDLVIAGDVIEHLPDPGTFLRGCKHALTSEGVLLITTVNVFGIVRFMKSLVGHEAVHNEHTAYYSINTMNRLAEMCGFEIMKAGYYGCEPHLARSGLNGFVSTIVERTASLGWPQFSEGLVVELRSH